MTDNHTAIGPDQAQAGKRLNLNATLAILALAGVAYALLSSIVIPALPTLQRELHTSEDAVTWLLTAYLLSAATGTAIIGRLGDMYGKERLLVWTMGLLVASTLVAALSSSLPVLIAARAVQGTAGGVFPLSVGIVRDEFPREKVATGIGFMSATLGVGSGIGIVMSGVVVEHLNWHWLFWIPLVVALVAGVLIWRFVPESPVRIPGRVNWLAAVLMSLGLCAILIAISQTTTWGWGSPKTIGLIVLGVVLCGLWVLVEPRSKVPLIDMTMMRVRGVWTTNLVALMAGAGMYAAFTILPQLAQLPKGVGFGASVTVSGLDILPATMGMMVVGLFAGSFMKRYGSKRALVLGISFVTASFCSSPTCTPRNIRC